MGFCISGRLAQCPRLTQHLGKSSVGPSTPAQGEQRSTCLLPRAPPSSVRSLFVQALGAFLLRTLLQSFLNVTPVMTLMAATPSAEQDLNFGCSGRKTPALETQEDSSELSANKWSCDLVLHLSSEHSPRCQRSPLIDGETRQTVQCI